MRDWQASHTVKELLSNIASGRLVAIQCFLNDQRLLRPNHRRGAQVSI